MHAAPAHPTGRPCEGLGGSATVAPRRLVAQEEEEEEGEEEEEEERGWRRREEESYHSYMRLLGGYGTCTPHAYARAQEGHPAVFQARIPLLASLLAREVW
ncbi:unnamed protein product [Prorocentrum cordatum]|uniref:Uncharacterized protein n=1 Tax=Prorocentrum cordatum TaxID=2364126 RepID=A0ABN9VZG7_9DINO|nr:unnamed protein product [Polarella glacialis]